MSSQTIAPSATRPVAPDAGRRLTGSSFSTAWLLGGLFRAFTFVSVAIGSASARGECRAVSSEDPAER